MCSNSILSVSLPLSPPPSLPPSLSLSLSLVVLPVNDIPANTLQQIAALLPGKLPQCQKTPRSSDICY